MSAPYWNLRDKAQRAVSGYMLTNASDSFVAPDDWAGSPTLVPVRTGFTADLVEDLPMVSVVCASSSRYLPEVDSVTDNTRLLKMRVSIRSAADERSGDGASVKAEVYHNELVAKVLDLLNQTDILAKLAAVGITDLTIQQFDLTDEGEEIVENGFGSYQDIEIVAIPQ